MDSANDNYEIAMKLLHSRYGKKQMSLDAHYVNLIDLAVAVLWDTIL